MPRVDVIVTAIGGAETARAVHDAGGLVGMRSSASRPTAGVPIEFVDWPFMLEEPSVTRHVDVVRREQPRYAVAPDVEAGRSLDDVLEVAERLEAHADVVIIVPKNAPVDAVPGRFRVGLPFRDGFDTNLGVNTFFDFQGRPVHVLGGNPTDHFRVADRFELDVQSVDSPTPLAWADGGRVWVGRRRGADDVDDLVDEGLLDAPALEASGFTSPHLLAVSRSARITFTVRNLLAAWNDPNRAVDLPARFEPGRGPPPPMDEPITQFGEELSVEEQRERFLEATGEREIGRVEREEPAETAPAGLERFAETATEGRREGGDMTDDEEQENKRRRWQLLQEEANEEIEALGLGEDALPKRNGLVEDERDGA